MKKILNVFLIILLCISIFAGCSARVNPEAGEDIGNQLKKEKLEKQDLERAKQEFLKEYNYQTGIPEELTFGMIGFIGNMNPFYTNNDSSKKINSMLYKPLFYITTEGFDDKINVVLADEVKYENKKVTIKLKNGLKWHDGKEMTADDVLYTYGYLVEDNKTVYADYMYLDGNPIKLKKLDKLTVELDLDRYSGSILQKLSEIKILPKHIFEGKEKEEYTPNESEFLIGNSAYAFSKYRLDETFNTEVIDFEYYDNSIYEKPQFEKISLRASANLYTNRYDLLDYNMQVGYLLPNDSVTFKRELYKNEIFDEGYDIAMIYKLEHEHVGTSELRRNIADMLLPSSLTGYFGMSNYTKAADSIFGITTKHKSPQNAYYNAQTADVAESIRRYQVDNDGAVLKFGFKMEEGEFQERIAITSQELYRTQEINLEIVPLFEEEYVEGLQNTNTEHFDFALIKHESIKSPDAYRNFYKSDGIMNYTGFDNDEIIKKFDAADAIEDYLERQLAYDDLQKALYEELPMNPLVNVKTSFVYDDRIDASEAVPDAKSYFIYPEKLTMTAKEVDKSLIEKYEIKEDQLELKPKYNNVNILAKTHNEGKVKGE